jgi:endonuclease/exonuclease/phosphatase family metal-dependent hydrolase
VTLTIATWNLESLFLPGTESGPPDQATFERKLASLAATITRLAPDVLAVQEVGDAAAFDELLIRLEGEWHTELSPDADDRGIRVGFLSRRPFTDTERIRAFPKGTDPVKLQDDGTTTTQMGRGALRVRVDADGTAVDLVTAHLKSKLLSFPNGRFSPRDEYERARYAGYALALRTAEAITLREHATTLLDGQGAQRALVVLGDLNDEPLAATTQILLGPPGSEFGTGGFSQPDRGDGQRLWNIAPELPEGRDFSRIFNGRPELIDHILISRKLALPLESADIGTTDLPSVTTDPRLRLDATASDHAPVLARFSLDE